MNEQLAKEALPGAIAVFHARHYGYKMSVVETVRDFRKEYNCSFPFAMCYLHRRRPKYNDAFMFADCE